MADTSADVNAYLNWDPKFRNLVSFIHGQEATVTFQSGGKSTGIVAGLSPDCGVVLSEAGSMDEGSDQYMHYTAEQLEAVTLKDTSVTDLIRNYCSDTFTDSAVASSRLMNGSAPPDRRHEKQLEPFDFDHDSDLEHGLDDDGKSWDYEEMMSANQLRGCTTSYKEDNSQYTNVQVPKLTAAQQEEAERQARDIMASSGYQARAELEETHTDEEEAYSAVSRDNVDDRQQDVSRAIGAEDVHKTPTSFNTPESRSPSNQTDVHKKTPTNEAEGGAQKTPTVTRTTAPSRESSQCPNETVGILHSPLPSSAVVSSTSSPSDQKNSATPDADKSQGLNPNAEVFRPRVTRPSQTPTPQTSRNPTPPRPGSAASRGSSVGAQQMVMVPQQPPVAGYVPQLVFPQVLANPALPKRAVMSGGRQNQPLSLVGAPVIAAPSNPLVVLNQQGMMHPLQQQQAWPYQMSRLVAPGSFPLIQTGEHGPSSPVVHGMSQPVIFSTAFQQQQSGGQGQPPSGPPTPGATPQSFAPPPGGPPLVALAPHALQAGHSAQQPGVQGSHNQQQPQYMLMGAGPHQHPYAAQLAAAVNQVNNVHPQQGPPQGQGPPAPGPHPGQGPPVQPPQGPPHQPSHPPPPHGPPHAGGPPPHGPMPPQGPPHSQPHFPQEYQ